MGLPLILYMYCRANIIFNQWKVTISQFLSFPSLLLQYITVRFLSFNWSTQMQPVIMHYSTLTAALQHTILLQCPLHLHLLQHPLDRNLLLSRFFPLKIPPHLLVYRSNRNAKKEPQSLPSNTIAVRIRKLTCARRNLITILFVFDGWEYKP